MAINKYFIFLLYLVLVSQVELKNQKLKRFLEKNPKFKEKLIKGHVKPTDFLIAYKKCSTNNAVKYLDQTPFTINEPNLCRGRVTMFIGIHSHNPHRNYRQIVRETYGSLNRIDNSTIRLAFFVGASVNEAEQNLLREESLTHRDIIQRNFVESYRNMTRKHFSLIEWTLEHCNHASYLFKTDDDVFVDLFHLMRQIRNGDADKGFLCSATRNSGPVRNKKGYQKKWFVTREEYRENKYPTYCEGYGYVVQVSRLPILFTCAMLRRPFWIDDVYIGGILAEKIGIPRTGFSTGAGFYFMQPSHASHRILDGVFYVAYWSQLLRNQWRKMWNAALQYSMIV